MRASTTTSTRTSTTASTIALTPMLAVLALMLMAAAAHAQQDLEPAVQTSPAASPTRGSAAAAAAAAVAPAPARPPGPAPAAASAPASAAVAPAKGAKPNDSIQLDTTQISGNRELPRVMYVVPWRRPDPGEFSGRPPNSLLDEALTPVDRDVFRRQNRYYSALSGEPGAPNSQPGAAATGVATPTPKDEK
jgi:hypothetical protein